MRPQEQSSLLMVSLADADRAHCMRMSAQGALIWFRLRQYGHANL